MSEDRPPSTPLRHARKDQAEGADPGMQGCAHLATLRRFDNKLWLEPKTGPLIPCERRLTNMEISEIQEATFGHRFENRDYDRPY